jgi:hypothetical protein
LSLLAKAIPYTFCPGVNTLFADPEAITKFCFGQYPSKMAQKGALLFQNSRYWPQSYYQLYISG